MAQTNRVLPRPGMAVRVLHLGAADEGVVERVLDDGRTVVVGGERFTLRPAGARYVREGEPSYGARLSFAPA